MNKKYIVRQNDIKDCGICCLLSIIKYYKGYIPLETLRLDTKTNNRGTTAYNLIKTAKKYGFNAIGKKNISLTDENIILPAIAHIITEKQINHFIVIYKITKNYIYIMDPAKGYKKINKEDFSKNWTNIILIFKPYKRIPLYQNKNYLKLFFFHIFLEEKNIIVKIIITDIIITFLSIILSYYFKIIISSIENNYISTTFLIIFIFLIINLMKITFNYHKNTLSIYLAKNIDLETIPEFLNHILKLPLNVITSRTTGEILKRVDELNNIKNLFIEVFITIINSLFLILSSTIFLYYISNQLFLILCVISILYIIVGLISGPLIYKKINDNIDLETEFNSNLSENISNIESIKNLNITNNTIDSLDYTYTEYQKNTLEYSTFMNNLEVIKSIINDLGLFTITSYGIYQISLSKLNLLSLITFNSLISYFIEPIENIINLLPKYHLIQLSFSKISDFLSIDEEKLGHEEKFSIGTISFKNISYSYDDCQNILNNLSLTINKNSHIIIKGHTGCGKSTLFKMLNRTIDDYEGTITINDINIKDYSLKTLRKNILYVSQREKIFTETIYKNIVLNNKISKEKLNTILSITKVEEILDKKAMRLDSILYDSGFNLSGGERQRIILARAMVANPSILILDESLSEIDNISENFILKNINTYLKNTTIIYISHTNTNSFKNIIEMDKLK